MKTTEMKKLQTIDLEMLGNVVGGAWSWPFRAHAREVVGGLTNTANRSQSVTPPFHCC